LFKFISTYSVAKIKYCIEVIITLATLMPYTPPTHKSDGFNCPLCNFYSHQEWFLVFYDQSSHFSNVSKIDKLELSRCVKCGNYLLWHDKKIIFPVVNGAPPAHPEMPAEVKTIYDEAKSIVSKSSRAAAALLRIAISVLIDHVIGKNKKSLNHNIGVLVAEKRLSVQIQQSLDYLRVIGDHELHPGVIEMEDKEINDYEHAVSLFELVNLIVEELISRPNKIKEYYERLPQSQKDQIKERDEKQGSPV